VPCVLKNGFAAMDDRLTAENTAGLLQQIDTPRLGRYWRPGETGLPARALVVGRRERLLASYWLECAIDTVARECGVDGRSILEESPGFVEVARGLFRFARSGAVVGVIGYRDRTPLRCYAGRDGFDYEQPSRLVPRRLAKEVFGSTRIEVAGVEVRLDRLRLVAPRGVSYRTSSVAELQVTRTCRRGNSIQGHSAVERLVGLYPERHVEGYAKENGELLPAMAEDFDSTAKVQRSLFVTLLVAPACGCDLRRISADFRYGSTDGRGVGRPLAVRETLHSWKWYDAAHADNLPALQTVLDENPWVDL
jgi:hypothetical protein